MANITMQIQKSKNINKKDSYDKFLSEIQKVKMKELWDNEEDEASY